VTATRRDPVQQRSRARVELIVAAATEILYEHGIDGLSTRTIAERSGVPVATIYRYFENSDQILAAFLDREMEKLDEAVRVAVLALDRVTVRSLIETATLAHFRHHQRHPQTVTVWFGARQSPAVRDRVKQADAQLANWLAHAVEAVGFVRDDALRLGTGLIVRLADRMFEYVLTDVAPKEQETLVRRFIEMVADYVERGATKAGLQGLPTQEFVAALGAAPVHLVVDEEAISLRQRGRSRARATRA
jgi:AcrR family transcriptional regulator